MDQTSNLKLPYIAPSQAQKHVTHNEAIRALDALVQLSVQGRDVTEPPADPQEGDRYLIGPGASGHFADKANQIAAWQDGAWAFFEPLEGWHAWIAAERNFVVFNMGEWSEVSAGTNPVSAVGIDTIADDTNRLALKSPASLFDHAGTSHQLKINKADDNQAASLLFQSNYQGRAEMGTMWGRDFRIKTSADGNNWHDVMVADSATGLARFPSGITHAATGKKQSALIFLPAAETDPTIYQMAGSSTPATARLISVAADIITLGTNAAVLFFGSGLREAAMVRLWNTSKSPVQSAWAKWDTSLSGLQVSNADHVKQWSAGDTIQIVDPVNKNIAVDISPMMQKRLGGVFAQDCALLSIINNGSNIGSLIVPCRDLSPVSSANLIYFRSDEQRVFNVTGVYG